MRIERTTPDSVAAHVSGERITNWQLGRISPMPSHIPMQWELVQLTSVARLESGHTPARNRKSYWDGTIPWISLHDSDLLDVPVIHNTSLTVSEEGIANSSARLLPKGTVVFSRTATVGKCTIMGREMATSQDFANYVCGDRLHNFYLMYLFRFMAPEWSRVMAGSTHNTIYMPVFQQLQILLPPKSEQEAIASVLSDADGLIESLEKLIAKKRQLKHGTMQELLSGKRRLPGFSGKWETKRLGDCLQSRPSYGINAPAVAYSERLPTYIRITDITEDGRFRPEPRVSVNSTFSDQYYLREGDLVFARTGASVGKSYLYRVEDGPLVYAGFLIRVQPNPSSLLAAYLANYVTMPRYWNWVRLMSMRSGQPGINGNEYSQLPVELPLLPEQSAIAAILLDMDAEIAALEAKLAKARQFKQGMMQELLTGRTRLI